MSSRSGYFSVVSLGLKDARTPFSSRGRARPAGGSRAAGRGIGGEERRGEKRRAEEPAVGVATRHVSRVYTDATKCVCGRGGFGAPCDLAKVTERTAADSPALHFLSLCSCERTPARRQGAAGGEGWRQRASKCPDTRGSCAEVSRRDGCWPSDRRRTETCGAEGAPCQRRREGKVSTACCEQVETRTKRAAASNGRWRARGVVACWMQEICRNALWSQSTCACQTARSVRVSVRARPGRCDPSQPEPGTHLNPRHVRG